MLNEIFREYDIRGIFGDDLNETNVKALGKELGAYFYERGVKTLSIGRDARTHGETIFDWLVSGLNLNSLCKTLKMPGKYDVAGDEVLELFYANQGAKISEYCESDTLNTYLLFLKYELLRGKILLSDYATNLVSMKENLEKTRAKMGYTDIFVNFIDDEILRIENS